MLGAFIESCFFVLFGKTSCSIESFFMASCFVELPFITLPFIAACAMRELEYRLGLCANWSCANAEVAEKPLVRAAIKSVAMRAFMGSPRNKKG